MRGRRCARCRHTEAADGAGAGDAEEARRNEKLLRIVLQLVNSGYLSKANARFVASPIADVQDPNVRGLLRGLHPELKPFDPAEMDDEPEEFMRSYVPRAQVTKDHMWEVFHSVPKMRAMAVDNASYEELQALYHGGDDYRLTLWNLVCEFNNGTIHPSVADVMGDLFLIGLEKRDDDGNVVGTRPIGIPAALRRLSGRVLMEAYSEEMGKFFTTTPVPPEMLVAAGHAADRKCNVPQQLGVGVKGGAEMIIASVRTHLGLNPGHAVASDDKRNGFNTMWRRAIFRGLRRWFPELIPTVRLWYARRGCLFTFGSLATDRDDRVYYSEEGCAQGDPLGPFLWAIGYHEALLRQQAAHPDTLISAYLDDTYACDEPLQAVACMDTGAAVTLELCNVASNTKKQCVWSPGGEAALAVLAPRISLKGTPHALPVDYVPATPTKPASGYVGGLLPGIKVLGAFIGEDEWCSERLCKRVRTALEPLKGIVQLEDGRHLRGVRPQSL